MNSWLSFLAAVLRRLPWLRGRVRALMAIARFCDIRRVRRRVGPYVLELDPRELSEAMMALGAYEREIVGLLRWVLRSGGTYVDVGAEIGFLAAHAAECVGSKGRLLLFEPDPRAFARLSIHLASPLGRRAPWAESLLRACSDSACRLTLTLAPTLGQSSLVEQGNSSKDWPRIEARAERLDDRLKQAGIESIQILKMDVEGHEIAALRGAADTLVRKAVGLIVIEKNAVLLHAAGYSANHLHAYLRAFGYVGAHADGRPIGKTTLQETVLENLVYARDEDALIEAFRGPLHGEPDSGFTKDELLALAAEAADPEHPNLRAKGIVQEALAGRLEQAIRQAEELLAERPELIALRGHLAHWYAGTRRFALALPHLERIVKERPEDVMAKRLLGEVRGNIPPAALPG